MHSKVIVASLVLALAAGFSGSLMKNTTKALAAKQENMIACNEHDHEHEHCHDCEEHEHFEAQERNEICALAPSRTLNKKEVRTLLGAKYLYLSRGLSETVNGSAKWFVFTAPYEGQFNFYTTGNMDTYGELRSSTASNSSLYVSGSTGGSGNNFRISYDFYRGQTLYLKVYERNGNSGNATIYVSHTHRYTQPAYPMGNQHRMFCTCGAYTTVTFTPDDYFSGHGHNMIHCSTCDNWIELPTSYPHTHYFYETYYNSSYQHVKVCACGYVEYASHTFDQIIRGPEYDEKHCSVCDAWVAVAHTHNYNQLAPYSGTQHKKVCSACGSYILENHNYTNYEYENMSLHRVSCACGNSYVSNHTFSYYDENGGHGVSGYMRCDSCDCGVPTYGIYDGGSAGYYYDDGDLRFFIFQAQESANYIFESTHEGGDPQVIVYDVNDDNYVTYYDEFYGEKGNGDFIFTRYMSAGQRILVGMHGYDYYVTGDYTLLVNKEHTHNYSQLVNYNYSQHRRVCSCGDSVLENHDFGNDYSFYSRGQHSRTCACGAVRYEEHQFTNFTPYNGHGLNGLFYCPLCDENIGVLGIYEGGESSYTLGQGEVMWYIFNPVDTDTYVFDCESDNDSYLEMYTYNHTTGQVTYVTYADDENPHNDFRGVFDLVADPNISYLFKVREYDRDPMDYDLRVYKAHYHNYNQLVYVDYNQHKEVCECGAEILEPHEFTNWQPYTKGQHKKTCACGAVRYEEHNFTGYVPYGHGHNESLFCEDCGAYIELNNYNNTESHGGYIEPLDCDWYIYEANESSNYLFDIVAETEIVFEIYVCGPGEVPTQITRSVYGQYGDAETTMYLENGDVAYVRVRHPDWEDTDYSLGITLAHTHQFEHPVSVGARGHQLICDCGETIIEEHNFMPKQVGAKIYQVCTDCGFRILADISPIEPKIRFEL